MNRYYLIRLIFLTFAPIVVYSQTNEFTGVSGSIETNNIYYLNDSIINAIAPKDKIGSNNYFKLDYSKGDFSAGIQYEAYLPPLIGYSPLLEGTKLINRFVAYRNDFLSFTAGNFYEQFGSGLILRTYEERSLGINNSLDGICLKLKPTEYLEIKTIWGKQRDYLELGEGAIRGADINFQLSQLILPDSPLNLVVGSSWVSKYQAYTGTDPNFPTTVNAYAGRVNLEYSNYSFYGEFVRKDKDPSFVNLYTNDKGSALLIQQSFVNNGFGVNVTTRRLENIDYRSNREERANNLTINYLPALTKQHKYQLAGIHPYSTRAKGEIGGQIELFKNFSKGSNIGGSNGMKIAFNASGYFTLIKKSNNTTKFIGIGDTLLVLDYSLELEKKITNRLKSTLSYIGQKYNTGLIVGGSDGFVVNHIAVIDLLFKLSKNVFIKAEVSELWGIKGEDDWSLLSSEISIAPQWNFFLTDMIQHVNNKIHYISGGISYTKSSTRILLTLGRSREGLQCSGGMCRYVPAYSGFNLSLTSTF